MHTSTMGALQNLKDAQFHALCDEILPRLHPWCFPLTPHGRNERDDSVRGQPDSYVGDSAENCRVAIQYSVQIGSWWSKVVHEVQEARAACPKALQIVVALPRDIDREKPRTGPGVKWHADAKSAATPANLTIVGGREIAQELDTASQDLRRLHLGIPCSRANLQTLLASCKESNTETIGRLKSLNRYNDGRYVYRDADHRLFALWQESLRSTSCLPSKKRNFLPLVADSGVGKTSLLADFIVRSSLHAPTLLLLARDLLLQSEDSLVRTVIDRVQGSIDEESRLTEESAIASIFAGKTPLTVVLDGLDETANADSLRRAISGWLLSRLGRASVLITSSRVEFWRNCRDVTWASSIVREEEPRHVAKPLRRDEPVASLDPLQGVALPGLFNDSELATAWEKAGRSIEECWALPSATRQHLRNPFAAAAALDLLSNRTSINTLLSRPNILEMWITNRLQHDADIQARISAELLRNALLAVANEAASAEGAWVNVDRLSKAPRFDARHPPGPVVERLIASGLLETRPERPDQIRFASEAIQDFFVAELTISEIARNPVEAASQFRAMPFSKAVSRLEPIGAQIAGQPFADDFIRELARLDGPMAAVTLRPGLQTYSSQIRQIVAKSVGALQSSGMEAEKAIAIELLGRMQCPESKEELLRHWTTNVPSNRLRPIISHAVIAHGIVELVEHVFRTWWFKHEHYFVDLGPELAASPKPFKEALAEYACQYLDVEQHTDDYRCAVTLLAYMGDDRATAAIGRRTQNAHPNYYESIALLRIGSSHAVTLYSYLIGRYLEAKGDAQVVDEEYIRWMSLVPYTHSIGRKPTDVLEDYVIEQITSTDKEQQHVGYSLAAMLHAKRSAIALVRSGALTPTSLTHLRGIGRAIESEQWLELWSDANIAAKKSLVAVSTELRDSRVEEVLIENLRSHELSGYCASALAQIGSSRACPAIRALLANNGVLDETRNWEQSCAFRALVQLRDPASVPGIVGLLKSGTADELVQYEGIVGLASIGTPEAEIALLAMDWAHAEERVRGLVCFGSRQTVERAIDLAEQNGGPKWLLESARYGFMMQFRSSNHVRTDIHIEPLLNYVSEATTDLEVLEYLESILDDIDTPAVRDLYAHWWSLQSTPRDVKLTSPTDAMLSQIALRELMRRGDARVLPQFIEQQVADCIKYRVSEFVIERFAVFERSIVLDALRTQISCESDEKTQVALLDLVGRLGEPSDALALRQLATSSDSLRVSNAAFEAMLRLTDPLRLAEHW